MSLKTIALFVELSLTSKAPACYAAELALRYGAHLIVIFVTPSSWSEDKVQSNGRTDHVIHEMIEQHTARERAVHDAASWVFETASAHGEISLEFRVILEDGLDGQAKLQFFNIDLAVVGYGVNDRRSELSPTQAMLLAAGIPFVIVPDDWNVYKRDPNAECVTVCWNASREARRAIVDSLPLLIDAESVLLVVVNAEGNEGYGDEPGADIGLFLSRHDVNVTVAQLNSKGGPVENLILRQARVMDADLIVLGACGPGRRPGSGFGDVTRFLLAHSPIPLFVSN